MADWQWQQDPNWWHFSGIGGVATSQFALALAASGKQISGSDGEIFEPVKSALAAQPSLQVYSDYDYKHLVQEIAPGQFRIPSRVIAGGNLPAQNRELQFANKRGIPVSHFAALVPELVTVPGKSIVVAGSFGKTTTTSLIVHMLRESGLQISQMVGGFRADQQPGVVLRTAETDYSVVEGDEYFAANWDLQAKFHYYRPDTLVLTGYALDHTDFYPTAEAYYQAFAKLVAELPADGLLIYNSQYPELVQLAKGAPCSTLAYQWQAGDERYQGKLLGDYNQSNLRAAATVGLELGLTEDQIASAFASFPGLQRRLEQKWQLTNAAGGQVTFIDDFGSTPGKAQASIAVVRAAWPTAKLIVLFEPNLGSRTAQALANYQATFAAADQLVLPPFSAVLHKEALDNATFAAGLPAGALPAHYNVATNSEEMLTALSPLINSAEDAVVLSLSSHASEAYARAIQEAVSHG